MYSAFFVIKGLVFSACAVFHVSGTPDTIGYAAAICFVGALIMAPAEMIKNNAK